MGPASSTPHLQIPGKLGIECMELCAPLSRRKEAGPTCLSEHWAAATHSRRPDLVHPAMHYAARNATRQAKQRGGKSERMQPQRVMWHTGLLFSTGTSEPWALTRPRCASVSALSSGRRPRATFQYFARRSHLSSGTPAALATSPVQIACSQQRHFVLPKKAARRKPFKSIGCELRAVKKACGA